MSSSIYLKKYVDQLVLGCIKNILLLVISVSVPEFIIVVKVYTPSSLLGGMTFLCPLPGLQQ